MTRQVLVCAVLAAVLLGGCVSGPGTGPSASDPTATERPSSISSDDIPGVTNGSLTNATALAAANEATLAERGGTIRVNRSVGNSHTEYRLVVGTDRATYRLSGSQSTGDDQSRTVSLWSNETTRVLRMTTDEGHTYRTSERRHDGLPTLDRVEDYLAAGNFTVANETAGDSTVVLTATEPAPTSDAHGPFTTVSGYTGRLVVSETGLIHNLTVSATAEGETHTYRFEVLRTGIERVSKPAWFDDVPASAWLDPRLTVSVENSSYLVIHNEGGDRVPRNATVAVTTNGTTDTATIETPLEAGDTRYAYVDATAGELRVTADRPSADAVDPVTSPVSVTIATEDGVTLHSGGMAWASESASANGTESGDEGSASSGNSAGGGSASGEAGRSN